MPGWETGHLLPAFITAFPRTITLSFEKKGNYDLMMSYKLNVRERHHNFYTKKKYRFDW